MPQKGNFFFNISHGLQADILVRLSFLCAFSLFSLTSQGRRHSDALADSVMGCVHAVAPFYQNRVTAYKARLYVKNVTDVERRNFLLQFVPSMSALRKGERQNILETYSLLNYTAPDIFDQKVTATVGTLKRLWEADARIEDYLHPHIYAATLINDKLLSPLSHEAYKYYRFRVDSIQGNLSMRRFCIRFTPRYSSYQLVDGQMWVDEHSWIVRHIRFGIRSEFFNSTLSVQMGESGSAHELLPVLVELDGLFRFFGNKIKGTFVARLDYDEVQMADSSVAPHRKGKKDYNLSSSYTLRTDTNALLCDTSLFSVLRPLPLSSDETELYQRHYANAAICDTQTVSPSRKRWRRAGSYLIEYNTLQLSTQDKLRVPPLINPLMWSYSPTNGFSFSQRLRYNRLLPGDRYLSVSPYVGYNFKHKEFYWRVNTDFLYNPSKHCLFSLETGNGNRIYNSSMLDVFENMPDSVFGFDQLGLRYYRDLYLKLKHRWEIVNGLSLDVNLAIHRRSGTHSNIQTNREALPVSTWEDEYNSFAPGLRLSWTPGQYYYMFGKRKVNLYSRYPTLSVDWEHGLPDILPHSGRYDRIEVDLQHFVPLGPMRDFYYRLGWGAFSKHRDTYFVDFVNFRRSNLPTGWGDDIGGVFQLLDGRWYNSSRQYVRANCTYEAPFLLLPYLGPLSRYALNERLYLGVLGVPHLKPYTEFGYGLGTHIFDIGVFVSLANWRYDKAGVKFTLELFSK